MESEAYSLTELALAGAAILVLICLSAFFSGSETGLTAASRARINHLSQQGNRRARVVSRLLERQDRLIGTILLGNNLVNILASSLATSVLILVFGEAGVVYATLAMTLIVVVFAEVLPKTYAITNPETAAAGVARPISLIILVFSPIVGAIRALVRMLLRLVGVQTDPDSQILAVREEIAGALQLGHSEGVVEKEDRDRILGALDLAERTVEEIMLHRSNIEMVDAEAEPRAILQQILESNYTRLPIYKGDQENIIGVAHAKDLMRALYETISEAGDKASEALDVFAISDVMMKPYFVPDTTTLADQMRNFLRKHTHFALVVDEYGSLEGLITLEDILEEIVGEITDEHDPDAEHQVKAGEDGWFWLDGAMTIRDLNRATDWSLPDDEANTIAGLVIHEAQMIPTVGQRFSFHGFRFEVMERENNRITRLRVRPLETLSR